MNADYWNSGLWDADRKTFLDIPHDTLSWPQAAPKIHSVSTLITIKDALEQPCGIFATLRAGGNLCGCVGSLEVHEPLYRSVHENTIKAATEDPWFSLLGSHQLESLEVHITILSP